MVVAKNGTYFERLARQLNEAEKGPDLFEAIVNAPFIDKSRTVMIELGIVVLLLANPKTKTIDRIALSQTEQAEGAVRMSAKPFSDIKIPIGHRSNIVAKAILSNQPQQAADWRYLFEPALTPREARANQAGAGIDCSVVYPLAGTPDGGALIYSFFQMPEFIGPRHHAFMRRYARLVSKRLSAA